MKGHIFISFGTLCMCVRPKLSKTLVNSITLQNIQCFWNRYSDKLADTAQTVAIYWIFVTFFSLSLASHAVLVSLSLATYRTVFMLGLEYSVQDKQFSIDFFSANFFLSIVQVLTSFLTHHVQNLIWVNQFFLSLG